MSHKKRERLRATPVEPERVAIIARRFPYFARLSEADQRELLGHVRVFLDEKRFEGCGGLELTDEIELTIAAQACLLLLHRETDYYPGLDAILVYPHAYRAHGRASMGGRVVVERDDVRLGESHQQGVVVLSWDAVRQGATDDHDGHNVVLHEFAHQLDQEDGAADGAPVLEHRSGYAPWARVFQHEFDALAKATEEGRAIDIDSYGATNPAEFFAVVTEQFFEKPEDLAKNHPRLYEQLSGFYKQDPLERLGSVFTPPPPEAPAEAPPAKPTASRTVFGIVEHGGDLVGVSDAFRESVTAIGCEPLGFLSTIHHDARTWGFVAEVFACPDPWIVAGTASIGSYGETVAFYSLLDNGTCVCTETRVRGLRWIRFVRWLSPRERGEHFFAHTKAGAPAAVYAHQRKYVQRVARRENARPLSRDPFTTYVACRIRSTTLLDAFFVRRTRMQTPVQIALFVVVTFLVLLRADALTRAAITVSVMSGMVAAILFGPPLAVFLERMRVRGKPVPADELLARAAEVGKVNHSDVARVVRRKDGDD